MPGLHQGIPGLESQELELRPSGQEFEIEVCSLVIAALCSGDTRCAQSSSVLGRERKRSENIRKGAQTARLPRGPAYDVFLSPAAGLGSLHFPKMRFLCLMFSFLTLVWIGLERGSGFKQWLVSSLDAMFV